MIRFSVPGSYNIKLLDNKSPDAENSGLAEDGNAASQNEVAGFCKWPARHRWPK